LINSTITGERLIVPLGEINTNGNIPASCL
jgi:hypothetical protein